MSDSVRMASPSDVERSASRTMTVSIDDSAAKAYQHIIEELNHLFVILNAKYFDNAIQPAPIISIQSGRTGRKKNCWCSERQVWRERDTETPRYFEINYTAELMDRPMQELVNDMAHQMVHIYNALNDVKDVSREGTYHNNFFKQSAEAVGFLCTSCKKKDGYSEVSVPTSQLIDVIAAIDIHAFNLIREVVVPKKRETKKKTKEPTSLENFQVLLEDALLCEYTSPDSVREVDVAKVAAAVAEKLLSSSAGKAEANYVLKNTNLGKFMTSNDTQNTQRKATAFGQARGRGKKRFYLPDITKELIEYH